MCYFVKRVNHFIVRFNVKFDVVSLVSQAFRISILDFWITLLSLISLIYALTPCPLPIYLWVWLYTTTTSSIEQRPPEKLSSSHFKNIPNFCLALHGYDAVATINQETDTHFQRFSQLSHY